MERDVNARSSQSIPSERSLRKSRFPYEIPDGILSDQLYGRGRENSAFENIRGSDLTISRIPRE